MDIKEEYTYWNNGEKLNCEQKDMKKKEKKKSNMG